MDERGGLIHHLHGVVRQPPGSRAGPAPPEMGHVRSMPSKSQVQRDEGRTDRNDE